MISMVCSVGITIARPLSAQSKSPQVRKLEQTRKEIQRRIAATDRKLKEIKSNSKRESDHLNLVRQQVADRKQVISILTTEVNSLQDQIDSLGTEIQVLSIREKKLQGQYIASLRAMQRGLGTSQKLLFLLSSHSLEEAMQRQTFLRRYARTTYSSAQELKEVQHKIELRHREINQTHNAKSQLLSQRDAEKTKLEQEEGRQRQVVQTLKTQEAQLTQELEKQRKEAQLLNNKIEAQIAKEIAEAEQKARQQAERREARRRAQREASRSGKTNSKDKSGISSSSTGSSQDIDKREEEPERKAVVHGGYAMDASELKLSGSFANNRGKLPCPVRGKYGLVRRFGVQQHSNHARVQVSSGGIDIKAYSDRGAYAVFEGVVSRIFVTPGYGTTVILRHGNYLTVYSNLSQVHVVTGQHVSTGKLLGTISQDGDGDRAGSLHFQLWHERNKQNPELWLKM